MLKLTKKGYQIQNMSSKTESKYGTLLQIHMHLLIKMEKVEIAILEEHIAIVSSAFVCERLCVGILYEKFTFYMAFL